MSKMHNPAHPGEVLREWIPEGMTVTSAAKELQVSRVTLSKVLNGNGGITAQMALRLAAWLGTTPDVWLGMQTQSITSQGKFVLKIIVGWADSFIVCPRGLVTAWAQKRAHPTFIDSKHNYLKNKLALHYIQRELDLLHLWHVKIEAWILEQAGIEFVPVQAGLRVVAK